MTGVQTCALPIFVARENSRQHKVEINWIESDLFSNLSGKKFGLIVCNPPYVETSLIQGRLRFEPRIALEAGNDGLSVINNVLIQAPKYLLNKAGLIIEFGCDQRPAVEEILLTRGCYQIQNWIKDYQGHWRGFVLNR